MVGKLIPRGLGLERQGNERLIRHMGQLDSGRLQQSLPFLLNLHIRWLSQSLFRQLIEGVVPIARHGKGISRIPCVDNSLLLGWR